MNSRTRNEAIVIACTRAGGITALARIVGVSPQLVSRWKEGKRPVSAVHYQTIESATGVPKHSLRVDGIRI